jgi:drug/metabolite transporter superfamily protein YnfA
MDGIPVQRRRRNVTVAAWFIFVLAAILEVGGDAVTRTGLRARQWIYVLLGACMLGLYGIVVNTLRWDFSRLLGTYVAVFALVSVMTGALYFRETIPVSTWIGLVIIVVGGLIIQFGSK